MLKPMKTRMRALREGRAMLEPVVVAQAHAPSQPNAPIVAFFERYLVVLRRATWTNISRTLAATRSSVGKRACVVIAVVAAIAVVAIASPASTKDLPYLAAPGAPASAFPKVERPVADIVSPSRSSEEKRDANNESGQLARFLGLKQGMTLPILVPAAVTIRFGCPDCLGHLGASSRKTSHRIILSTSPDGRTA